MMQTHLKATTQTTQLAQRIQSSNKAQASSDKTSARQDISMLIGWVLQGGVIISSAIILLGVLLLLLSPGGLAVQAQTFPHTLNQIWNSTLALQPQGIIVLGLLLLIATPVIRVIVSVIAFAVERDRQFIAISFLVLAILCLSFLLGKGGA